MLKIAVCDDDRKDRGRNSMALIKISEKWDTEFETSYYESGEELKRAMEEQEFDVILLDILMGGIDGIETARQIREMGEDSYIIFISSYDKRLRELFKFKTTEFLDKPLDIQKLEETLLMICEEVNSEKEKIYKYTVNKQEKFVYLKDIMFFESQDHYVNIVTNKETIQFKGTLKEVWEEIETNENFILPHRSYILNLKYTTFKDSSTVAVEKENLVVTVGRAYKEATTSRYMKYLRRSVGL